MGCNVMIISHKGISLADSKSIDVRYVGSERSWSDVRLPLKHRKKTDSQQLHPYGEPQSPAEHYELGLLGGPTDVMSSKMFALTGCEVVSLIRI
jgi:hypothetical protein